LFSSPNEGVSSPQDIADVLEAELKAKGPNVLSAETIQKIHKVLSQYGMTISLPLTLPNPTDDTLSDLTDNTEAIAPTPSVMIYAEDFARMATPVRLLENTVIAMESKSPDLSAARLFQQPFFSSLSQYESTEEQPPLTTLLQHGSTSPVS
jgi:hypothetical protein